ncbi:MAG: 1,6-anhydro-N-acetylmuramyl-L-alanine amidase AmpD [Methylococcales bacterium]|nr:1,6-anhydro-N-acetylmuramyl-L-alanine amidase AmpD [Methylococcales bacterium]
MLLSNHCLSTASLIPSPHQDARPDPEDISLLVIHCISLPPGEYGGGHIDALFQGQLATDHPYFASIAHLKVSAHLLIDRAGQLTQFVPFDRRAWHAGASCYQGRARCNDFSIGIELEGTDTSPFTDAQYDALHSVIALLLHHYPRLSPQRIVGHSDIAPGRKTDPGHGFDWPRLRRELELATHT